MNAETAEIAEKRELCVFCGLCVDRSIGVQIACESLAMTQARQRLGKIGENLACVELERRGYAILARRYRHGGAEIDIVARDGTTLVFVEVKAREGREFGDGAEAVTRYKRRRMVAAAMDYLVRNKIGECSCRFDVISIQLGEGEPQLELFPNAFDASSS